MGPLIFSISLVSTHKLGVGSVSVGGGGGGGRRQENDYFSLSPNISNRAVGQSPVFGSSPTPPIVSKLDRRYMGRLRKRDNLLTGGERGKGVEEEPNHTTARKAGPI